MWKKTFKSAPHFDLTEPVVIYLLSLLQFSDILFWMNPDGNVFLLGLCYLLLQFPSVVLRASPFSIRDTRQPSFLHTPWCLLNSSTWKSPGCFKCIQHFFPIICVGDKLFLTNCLGSLRGTWFEKAFSFPSNILVARQLPTSALPELAHCEVEQSSYISSEIAFNIHMLQLLPHGFSSLKNINISNNLEKLMWLFQNPEHFYHRMNTIPDLHLLLLRPLSTSLNPSELQFFICQAGEDHLSHQVIMIYVNDVRGSADTLLLQSQCSQDSGIYSRNKVLIICG